MLSKRFDGGYGFGSEFMILLDEVVFGLWVLEYENGVFKILGFMGA